MKKPIYHIVVFIMTIVLSLGSYFPAQAVPKQLTGSGQPVYAYYYLWWSSNHWRNKLGPNYPYNSSPLPLPATTDADGCAPTSSYAGNQLIDVASALYSQDDPGVIENDIRAAKSAGITGFWVNWKGNGTTNQTLTSVTYTARLAEAFAASNRVGGFVNWVSYEAASMPSAEAIINDMNFAYAQFGSNQAWEKINGKPVFVFTGSRKYSDADVTRVSNALRGKFYFVGDENRRTLTNTRIALYDAVTYYWSSQDPYNNPASFDQIKEMGDKVHAAGKRWIAPFTPGFNTVLLTGGTTCVPRKNGDTMRRLWNGNSASNPDGRILISWNEIGENSHVKPLRKWGNTYLNVLSDLINGSAPSPTQAPVSTATVPSSRTYDNTDGALVYSSGWENVLSTASYNGSFSKTMQNGSSVVLNFIGRSFSILYKANQYMGKLDIYVDGQYLATLNEYSAVLVEQKRWDYPSQFALGTHTLKLVFQSVNATINRGSLDAIIIR